MQLLTLRQNRVLESPGLMRSGLLLASILGLSLAAAQVGSAPNMHAASPSSLYYRYSYDVDSGWLCYEWSNGVYHCTHHWRGNANGTLISSHASSVPNVGATARMRMPAPHTPAHTPGRTPTPMPPPSHPASGSVAEEIRSVFGPYASAALAIAACESGYNPSAYNRSSGASGVFQFLPNTWAGTSYAGYSPFNAWANIHAAHQVFQRDGYSWREWQCQP